MKDILNGKWSQNVLHKADERHFEQGIESKCPS
jgi:hypothetical protein